MRRVLPLVLLTLMAVTGCSSLAPQAGGATPTDQQLRAGLTQVLKAADTMDAANTRGDTAQAKAAFSDLKTQWNAVSAAVVRARSYPKLKDAFGELDAEFARAAPRQATVAEGVDRVRDRLRATADELKVSLHDQPSADPARPFKHALQVLDEMAGAIDQSEWARARSGLAEFAMDYTTIRPQLSGKDQAIAGRLARAAEALENALKAAAPDKALVKAAAADAGAAIRDAGRVLGIAV